MWIVVRNCYVSLAKVPPNLLITSKCNVGSHSTLLVLVSNHSNMYFVMYKPKGRNIIQYTVEEQCKEHVSCKVNMCEVFVTRRIPSPPIFLTHCDLDYIY